MSDQIKSSENIQQMSKKDLTEKRFTDLLSIVEREIDVAGNALDILKTHQQTISNIKNNSLRLERNIERLYWLISIILVIIFNKQIIYLFEITLAYFVGLSEAWQTTIFTIIVTILVDRVWLTQRKSVT